MSRQSRHQWHALRSQRQPSLSHPRLLLLNLPPPPRQWSKRPRRCQRRHPVKHLFRRKAKHPVRHRYKPPRQRPRPLHRWHSPQQLRQQRHRQQHRSRRRLRSLSHRAPSKPADKPPGKQVAKPLVEKPNRRLSRPRSNQSSSQQVSRQVKQQINQRRSNHLLRSLRHRPWLKQQRPRQPRQHLRSPLHRSNRL